MSSLIHNLTEIYSMKKFIFAILVMISSITFVQEDAFACTGGTCNDAAWQQQQQQQQGTSIATDNRNYATNSPTAVMSANNNVYTGNMNYMMDGVSCPSTQLYAGVGAGTTYFNPGGANSQNYQVNGGIAIPLDSQTCEQVMALKEKMYTRLDTEAALRMCMALKNDGLHIRSAASVSRRVYIFSFRAITCSQVWESKGIAIPPFT
jgi:hypothetical protein